MKLNEDYPIYRITEGVRKAYNGLRKQLGRNPGIKKSLTCSSGFLDAQDSKKDIKNLDIKEILHCIDPNISLEKYS